MVPICVLYRAWTRLLWYSRENPKLGLQALTNKTETYKYIQADEKTKKMCCKYHECGFKKKHYVTKRHNNATSAYL